MTTNSLAKTPLKAAHPPLAIARTSQVDFVVGNDMVMLQCCDLGVLLCNGSGKLRDLQGTQA